MIAEWIYQRSVMALLQFAHVKSIHTSPPDALFIAVTRERAAHARFPQTLTHRYAESSRVRSDQLTALQ